MDSVQHADTGHGRGSQIMLDTDIHTAQTARGTRPSGLGDLRFAGTVATGLVAGTLGLGALAAPLVGWRDWPSGLTQDQPTTVQLAKPAAARTANTARSRGQVPGTSAQTPGGASALSAIGGPALGGTAGGAAAGGGLGVLAIPAPASSGSGGSTGTSVGDAGSSAGTVRDTGTGFIAPNTSDSDADGIPDVYEAKNGLDPNNAGDAAVQNSDTGLSN